MQFSVESIMQGSKLARIPFWRPLLKPVPAILFLAGFLVAAFTSSSWIETPRYFIQNFMNRTTTTLENPRITVQKIEIEIPLYCNKNQTQTCPTNYPNTFHKLDINESSSNPVCPDYFKWIHEDLRPWKTSGITRDMLERANRTATFRLVILGNKAYVQNYRKAIQTRDVFTIWGILQLLRKYPGRLPDLEIMFDTEDRPVIRSSHYHRPNATGPPPLFRYCGDEETLDIVFPDWSFWGWYYLTKPCCFTVFGHIHTWAEINIKPWDIMLKDIRKGNNETKWINREPYAYWKGNPTVADARLDLLKCNASDQQDWNARIFIQDWNVEGQQGFKHSNVADQCTYRYKIYVEGYGWSVSEKYILACDSPTLIVQPQFYDFFLRSLQPLVHYWPVRNDEKCKSLKFAVDWGNKHKKKAQKIGKASSKFMQEELKMDYIYDYMYHLLNEYAKLLKFEARIPKGAVELCSEAMACNAEGLEGRKKEFMMESLVKGPSITNPCTLPPYQSQALAAFARRKTDSIMQVKMWEKEYWESLNKQ